MNRIALSDVHTRNVIIALQEIVSEIKAGKKSLQSEMVRESLEETLTNILAQLPADFKMPQ